MGTFVQSIRNVVSNGAQFRKAVTIANGAAVSSNITLKDGGAHRLAVLTPAAWTAADIAFQASVDGVTWVQLRTQAGLISRITVVPTAAAALLWGPEETRVLGAFKYIRLNSVNTASEAAVNQGAARTLTIILL